MHDRHGSTDAAIPAAWRGVLGEGLAVTLVLALAPSRRPPTPAESGIRLLDAIAMLEDGGRGGRDETPSLELQRLEAKVDLLMQLLTTWMQEQLPAPVSATLSAEGVVLPVGLLETADDRLELYPSTAFAQPLVLGLETVCELDGALGARWCFSDDGLREALGRWVFRMHRRAVARARR
ncbi:PilZ domain-containing protein [Marichromatium gracile]|uniref:PilZ domain-containing protein n=1 Tax=Marichromatium gracile TaxID=1048 RepID=UPI001F47257F|nr:PilZ domain-containing protein [Marichromatium gracile]MCF1184765.1 PilZ domain-containing protein [Marichromatium gracile]